MPVESATFVANSTWPVGRCYGYHPTTLAKKARTPTPPRSVQAPKRRDTKQRQHRQGERQGAEHRLRGVARAAKGPAPWPPEYAALPDRLKPLGLNALSAEALAFHIHQHLDVFVNGKSITVPQFIGIDDGSFITELHTHDSAGIIHVES